MGDMVRGQIKLAPAGAVVDSNQVVSEVAIFIVASDGSLVPLLDALRSFTEDLVSINELVEGLTTSIGAIEDRLDVLEA